VTRFRAALCTVLLLGLGGCISLFPKLPPAQLYRFGVAETAAPAAPPSGAFNVAHMATSFNQAAAGDRILTTNGTEAAYIADARWASPAEELFDEAEQRAFDQSGGAARLLRRGETASANSLLALDVQSFEARYGDPKAPPMVVVTVHAVLISAVDRKVMADQVFVSRVPASDNRVSAIVDAFDSASTDVLNQVVGWTDQRAGAGA
jgi:cholesterol transport system auxiliary component